MYDEQAMVKFIDVLRNEPEEAFDYIANNYNSFDKDELVTISKELLYAIHTNVPREQDDILSDVADELADRYDYLYEDEQSRGR